MSDVDFTKRMSQVPDEELFTVISSEGFLPAAVDAAKAELERRNLKPEEVARISAEVQEYQSVDANQPSVPLSLGGKIAFFLFGPVLLWSILAALVLRYRGYQRKSNEAFKWIAIGFAFWATLSFVIAAVA